jgi:hypothetical protein
LIGLAARASKVMPEECFEIEAGPSLLMLRPCSKNGRRGSSVVLWGFWILDCPMFAFLLLPRSELGFGLAVKNTAGIRPWS